MRLPLRGTEVNKKPLLRSHRAEFRVSQQPVSLLKEISEEKSIFYSFLQWFRNEWIMRNIL
ncbi:Hypothetical predicted protein [Podarcis lilfordi]|uniref:Uncharacterized protein n=1 Tax=Podarcis lilfordi TaxID=74358 RepID=A0AA35P9T8_9SAUR|nr:Hypothetical predicted protein [Podarcis lilfordi]